MVLARQLKPISQKQFRLRDDDSLQWIGIKGCLNVVGKRGIKITKSDTYKMPERDFGFVFLAVSGHG